MSYILKCFGLIFDIYFEIFLRQNALNVRLGYHVSLGSALSRDMVKVRSTKVNILKTFAMAVCNMLYGLFLT